MKQEIYVDVRHQNFWWGIYNFTSATDWEDLVFYEKKADAFVQIGIVCVCSRSYLEHGLTGLADDPDAKDFVEKIKQFLLENTLVYHYYYDKPDDEDFYEVAFEAARDEKGVKPCSIEMWYPGDGIDIAAVEACTVAFCKKFLKRQVDVVLFKEIPPFEETAREYQEEVASFHNSPVQVAFTDELVESLAQQWKMPAEKVLEILLRSV